MGVSCLPTRVIFRELFGVPTATPLQLAICRLLDGEAVTKPEQLAALEQAAGGLLPSERPTEFYLLAAIRSAKSMIAAAQALRASQTVDLSQLRHGETARYSIISTSKDNADVIFAHLKGTIYAEPMLRHLLAAKPTARVLKLRHPSGRLVEIYVAAGARAGSTLVSRWSLGVTFDEAPRMVGQEEGVINLDESAHAVRGRLLPGAQILYVGSPWAPFGPVYNAVTQHYGSPGPVCVVRAAGPQMNPIWWTPERCEALRSLDPDAYATDVLGEFRHAEAGLFGSELEQCVRKEPADLRARPENYYVAAIDPGMRQNSWTLTVWTREHDMRRCVLAREWKASKAQPLNPDAILAEMAIILRPYRCRDVWSDQWSFDALRALADRHGLLLREKALTQTEAADAWVSMKSAMIQRLVDLPAGQLVEDLRRLVKRMTSAAFAIHLPDTADGRHADFAPSVLRGWLAYVQPAHIVKTAAEEERERIERLRKQQSLPPPETLGRVLPFR